MRRGELVLGGEINGTTEKGVVWTGEKFKMSVPQAPYKKYASEA